MGGIGSTLHVAPGIPLNFRTSECSRFFRHLQTGLNRVLCAKIALPDHFSRFVQNRKNRKLFFLVEKIFFEKIFFFENVEIFDTFSSFSIFRFFEIFIFRKIFGGKSENIFPKKSFRPTFFLIKSMVQPRYSCMLAAFAHRVGAPISCSGCRGERGKRTQNRGHFCRLGGRGLVFLTSLVVGTPAAPRYPPPKNNPKFEKSKNPF